MSYKGQTITLPFGQIGLRTDESVTQIPPSALIEANNIRLSNNFIEKSAGSTKITSVSLGSKILNITEYRPSGDLRRLIAVTEDGNVWRDAGAGFVSIGTVATPLRQQDVHFLECGLEVTGNNKKLFIYTGTTQVQVIDGDAGVIRDINTPSPDWASSGYPTFGLVYQGRVMCLGGANDPYRVYISDFDDHENNDPTDSEVFDFSVFSGEADRLFSAIVFRGIVLLFKYPFGVYFFDGRQSISLPTITKYSDAFGLAAPHAVVQGLGDVLAMNTFGSLTSLAAADKFGDLEAADVFAQNKVEDYFRTLLARSGFEVASAIYYQERKTFYFTARTPDSAEQNILININANDQIPKFTIETKDQPTCLALRRDDNNIQRPIYGDANGDVFQLDGSAFNVNGQPYQASAQLAYTDFGFASPDIADKNKIFDFVSVTFRLRGSFDFFIDVFVDGGLRDTIRVPVLSSSTLDNFELDVDRLGAAQSRNARLPIRSGYGRRISLRFYNTQLDESFSIEQASISFRLSNEGVIE